MEFYLYTTVRLHGVHLIKYRHNFTLKLLSHSLGGLPTYLWLWSPLLDLGHFFSSLILYTVGRTPWTGDQSVARALPAHRTTQTETKRIDIDPLSGIRTHDPSVRANEDSSCLRPHGLCDQRLGSLKP
jgi:hypothetical protein